MSFEQPPAALHIRSLLISRFAGRCLVHSRRHDTYLEMRRDAIKCPAPPYFYTLALFESWSVSGIAAEISDGQREATFFIFARDLLGVPILVQRRITGKIQGNCIMQ